MSRKQPILCLVLWMSLLVVSIQSQAQSITLQVKEAPLEQVLFELTKVYGVEFTADSSLINSCLISVDETYSSEEEALEILLQQCGLQYKKRGSVYILYKKKDKEVKKQAKEQKYYTYAGLVQEESGGNVLVFATIIAEGKTYQADSNGVFNFRSSKDLLSIEVQYLGYYSKTITLSPSKTIRIALQGAKENLEEVWLQSYRPKLDKTVGEKPGAIQLNHNISTFLPGNRDNGIYNLLRLQPGIMAAGEQTNDYTIWGSYEGQTYVQYDNMRVFNTSNYGETQSVIHPMMVKYLEVEKGGFSVEKDNRVGANVSVYGKDGDYSKIKGSFNINNQAISAYVNVPIRSNITLQTAYRFTYEDWFGNPYSTFSDTEQRKESIMMKPVLLMISM